MYINSLKRNSYKFACETYVGKYLLLYIAHFFCHASRDSLVYNLYVFWYKFFVLNIFVVCIIRSDQFEISLHYKVLTTLFVNLLYYAQTEILFALSYAQTEILFSLKGVPLYASTSLLKLNWRLVAYTHL
jgi:hypothetical protein